MAQAYKTPYKLRIATGTWHPTGAFMQNCFARSGPTWRTKSVCQRSRS